MKTLAIRCSTHAKMCNKKVFSRQFVFCPSALEMSALNLAIGVAAALGLLTTSALESNNIRKDDLILSINL
jgi:hypothetical protein